MSESKLSADAQRLLELCGGPQNSYHSRQGQHTLITIAQALEQEPGLADSLDEYVRHRDAEATQICERQVAPRLGHELINLTWPNRKSRPT